MKELIMAQSDPLEPEFDGFDLPPGTSGTDTLYGGNAEGGGSGPANAVHAGSAYTTTTTYCGYYFCTLVVGNSGDNWIYGGGGIDTLQGLSGDDRLYGGWGSDRLFGDAGADTLHGGARYDLVSGGDGDDVLYGYQYWNTLFGGAGADTFFHGHDDTVFGGDGDDTLIFASGESIRKGAAIFGVEYILSPSTIIGTSGDDTLLYGGQGSDRILGSSGEDEALFGGGAADRLFGGDDSDSGFGGHGNDSLYGGSGADHMQGDSGRDLLLVGSGDFLVGGSGADSFFFDGAALNQRGGGVPTIDDFDADDRLVFATGLEVGSFTYLEDGAFSAGGSSEARFDTALDRVEVDMDGDAAADQVFALNGINKANQLSSADFLWL